MDLFKSLFKFIWHKESGQYNLLVMIIRAGVVISEWDSVSPAKVINQPHTFNFELGQVEHVIRRPVLHCWMKIEHLCQSS